MIFRDFPVSMEKLSVDSGLRPIEVGNLLNLVLSRIEVANHLVGIEHLVEVRGVRYI